MNKFSKMLMTDTFEVKGKWFLPEADSEQAVSGILKYSPQKMILDLIGEFDSIDVFDDSGVVPFVVHGYSESGECFSLFGVWPLYEHHICSSVGVDTISYNVDYFYIGAQFINDEKDHSFDSADFSFTSLDAWLDYKIVNYHSEQEYSIGLNPSICNQEPIIIQSMNLKLNETFRWEFIRPKEFYLYEKHELLINRFYRLTYLTEQLFSIREIQAYTQQIRNLLTLIIGSPMYFSYLAFNSSNDQRKISCRIFFKQCGDLFRMKHLSPYNSSILIKRYDIKAEMSSIFDYWFWEQEKLSECLTNYINDKYIPTHIGNKFLNIIKGLESHHRFFREQSCEKQLLEHEDSSLKLERNKLLSYIEENISDENKEYFLERIEYRKEMSLRDRLKDIFDSIPEKLLNRLFGELSSNNKKNSIIATIVDTRNYYTHKDKKKNYHHIAKSNLELSILTKRLSVLLQYQCLVQIGIPSNVVIQRLIDTAGL